MLVLHGYGLRVSVERGRLAVQDGIGASRRAGSFARATGGVRRLVVIGHTGFITFEALRWLTDVGAAFAHIDGDGTVVATWGPPGADRAALRRAQARAGGTAMAIDVARYLLHAKLHGQHEVLTRLPNTEDARAVIAAELELLVAAETAKQLLTVEATAASAYWSAWASVRVPFARKDAPRVPNHWRTFGARLSPLTAAARNAINPANALLNYLYAILETEARIAALAVGLDPGLGVLHTDQPARDSLALDLLEPVRPGVDAYLLDLLGSHTFRARDFIETRAGVCRVSSDITQVLAETAPTWARTLAPVAERVAQTLARATHVLPPSRPELPTPLTQSNRSAGRDGVRRGSPGRDDVYPARLPSACVGCGVVLPRGKRRYCDDCLPERYGEVLSSFTAAGPAALAGRRTEGRDPSHGGEAARRRGQSIAHRNQEWVAWEAVHGKPDPERFQQNILPGLVGVPLSRMMQATGLSLRYCSLIRRGAYVPNGRHWDALRALASDDDQQPTAEGSPEDAPV